MVVSGRRRLRGRVRQLANHGGGANKYDNVVAGTNSRLDTLQAAVLRVKLADLDTWNAERRERVEAYTRALEGVPGVRVPREARWARSAWHLYTIRAAQPRRPPEASRRAGDLHRGPLPAADPPPAGHGRGARAAWATCPSRSGSAREVLSLPLYPELPIAAVDEIAGEVRRLASGR